MQRSRLSLLTSLVLIAAVALPYYAPMTCRLLDRMEMPMGCETHGTMSMIGPTSGGMDVCQIPACGLAHVAPVSGTTTGYAVPEPLVCPLPTPPPLFQSIDLAPPAPPPQA